LSSSKQALNVPIVHITLH